MTPWCGRSERASPPALAITTQVCEMSLDMDADLLVTEECPVTALIQRMGRCNREQDPRPLPRSGEVLVYRPDDPKPYDDGLADRADGVPGGNVRSGVARSTGVGGDSGPGPVAAGRRRPRLQFVASGPYAMGGEEDFRDIEAFNVQAVVKGDIPAFLKAEKKEQPGWTLPAPRRLAPRPTQRGPAAEVAIVPGRGAGRTLSPGAGAFRPTVGGMGGTD